MYRCFICRHAERAGIEGACAEGSVCAASRRFGVPVAELYHHLTVHVRTEPEKPSDDPVADALDELAEATGALMARATIPAADPRLAARVLGLRQRQLESLVRIEAARKRSEKPDLSRTPEWADLRTIILEALGPYPEALQALAEALDRREGSR